jgi:hypothetical protein
LTDKYYKQKRLPRETLRKEVVSLVFYSNKANDTLHKSCESVIVGYALKKVRNEGAYFIINLSQRKDK